MPPLGQGRWVRFTPLDEQDYGPWYSPTAAVKTARDYYGKKVGLHTNADMLNMRRTAAGTAYKRGLQAGPEAMSTGQASELAARKVSAAAGKKLGAAADYTADVMKKGTSALRRGLEDNPSGIGAAAVGAGLGALGISKLLRRRRASA